MPSGIVINISGSGEGAAEALRLIEERMKQTAERGHEMSEQLAMAGEKIRGAFEMAGIGLGLREVFEGFKGMLEKSMELGVELGHLSQQTGISIENLSTLKYVSDQSGVGFETLTKAFKKLSQTMYEAEQGSAKASRSLAQAGVTAKVLKETGGDLFLVMEAVAGKFSGMQDGFEKNALASQLFGRAGQQLIPILNGGAAAIENYRQDAENLGVVLNEEGVAKLEEMHKSVASLKSAWEGLALTLTSVVGPSLTSVAQGISGIIQGMRTDAPDTMKAMLGQYLQMVSGGSIGGGLLASGVAGMAKSQQESKTAPSAGKKGPGFSEVGYDKKGAEEALHDEEERQRLFKETEDDIKKQIDAYAKLADARLRISKAMDDQQLAEAKSAYSVQLTALEASHKDGEMSEIDYLERRLKLVQSENDKERGALQKKASDLKSAGASNISGATPQQLDLYAQLVGVETKLREIEDERAKSAAETTGEINAQVQLQKSQQRDADKQKYADVLAEGYQKENSDKAKDKKTANTLASGFTGMVDEIGSSALKGKMSVKQMADSVIADLERMALKVIEERWIGPAMQSMFGLGAPTSFHGATPSLDTIDNSITDTIPMDASGGDIGSGGMAIVGDGGDGSGSELFAPKGPGTVLPHDVLEGIAKGGQGGGGAPNVSVVNVNNSSSPVTMKQTGVSWDSGARQFIIKTVLEDMQQGGPTSMAMRSGG